MLNIFMSSPTLINITVPQLNTQTQSEPSNCPKLTQTVAVLPDWFPVCARLFLSAHLLDMKMEDVNGVDGRGTFTV